MRPPSFEEYLLLSVRMNKPGPRTDTVMFLQDQIRAGFFPGPYRNFRAALARYIQTIPDIHFRVAAGLWRDYNKFLSVRAQKQRRMTQRTRPDSFL